MAVMENAIRPPKALRLRMQQFDKGLRLSREKDAAERRREEREERIRRMKLGEVTHNDTAEIRIQDR